MAQKNEKPSDGSAPQAQRTLLRERFASGSNLRPVASRCNSAMGAAGAGARTRTGTGLHPNACEAFASTSSATPATLNEDETLAGPKAH